MYKGHEMSRCDCKKKWPHLIVCTFRIKLINQMICVKSQGKGKPVYIFYVNMKQPSLPVIRNSFFLFQTPARAGVCLRKMADDDLASGSPDDLYK